LSEDIAFVLAEVVGEFGAFGDIVDVVIGVVDEVGDGGL
jgi:hypothetical protein